MTDEELYSIILSAVANNEIGWDDGWRRSGLGDWINYWQAGLCTGCLVEIHHLAYDTKCNVQSCNAFRPATIEEALKVIESFHLTDEEEG